MLPKWWSNNTEDSKRNKLNLESLIKNLIIAPSVTKYNKKNYFANLLEITYGKIGSEGLKVPGDAFGGLLRSLYDCGANRVK
ncbi:MAG: hypothetical protein A4S09_06905 [Proteobacteria bacterium SG_bin7]|nr:MAG: hypothetical protein A4S09_06905 [Proteobacteria bacterium SG_bin7]